jgi:hypothetical protein
MRILALVAALVVWTGHAFANEALLGNWKLVSFYTEDTQTKQRVNAYGEHPTGAIGFTAAGRFFAFATADGRKAAQTPEEQAAAYRTVIAYTGKWRVDGDKFITKVDVSANPALVGSEQVRYWRIVDGKLHITTAPLPNPNVPGSTMIGTLVWDRE